ncbi:MAG TPA: hypothetical protein VN608_09630 [Clostridia bacterium]|nr:hypothetical protein [Clostridia bacterium]
MRWKGIIIVKGGRFYVSCPLAIVALRAAACHELPCPQFAMVVSRCRWSGFLKLPCDGRSLVTKGVSRPKAFWVSTSLYPALRVLGFALVTKLEMYVGRKIKFDEQIWFSVIGIALLANATAKSSEATPAESGASHSVRQPATNCPARSSQWSFRVAAGAAS